MREQLEHAFGIPHVSEPSESRVRVEVGGSTIVGWCPVSGKRQYARPGDVPTRYKNHGLEPYECPDCSMFHGTTEVTFLRS